MTESLNGYRAMVDGGAFAPDGVGYGIASSVASIVADDEGVSGTPREQRVAALMTPFYDAEVSGLAERAQDASRAERAADEVSVLQARGDYLQSCRRSDVENLLNEYKWFYS